jgi:hypothetical protein
MAHAYNPVFRRLRHEECGLENSLDYIGRSYFK